MDLAKSLEAADHYIELSRSNPDEQFSTLKADNPYGFDIGLLQLSVRGNLEANGCAVVEATGSVKLLEDSIHYVRRGGTLVVYGYVGRRGVKPSSIVSLLFN